jgi:hypothetical protein
LEDVQVAIKVEWNFESRDQILDIKVWQIYPLFKGLNHIQGLDIALGVAYISGL